MSGPPPVSDRILLNSKYNSTETLMKPKQVNQDKLPPFMVRSDLYLSQTKLINCPKNFHTKMMNEEINHRLIRRNSVDDPMQIKVERHLNKRFEQQQMAQTQ